jgi:E3 ubiquitin-protein ligase HUWE1
MVNEDISNNSIFLYEPTIIKDLADILNPDKPVYWEIRTDALIALNAMAHYRSRFSETLNALNASANHGVLTYIFRKLLASMEANEELDFPSEFADALFSFIFYIITTNTGGNAVISAGMIQTFTRFIPLSNPSYLKLITRCIVLLDNIIYGFSNALNIFVNADGVNMIVNRIKLESDFAIKGSSPDAMDEEETRGSNNSLESNGMKF